MPALHALANSIPGALAIAATDELAAGLGPLGKTERGMGRLIRPQTATQMAFHVNAASGTYKCSICFAALAIAEYANAVAVKTVPDVRHFKPDFTDAQAPGL